MQGEMDCDQRSCSFSHLDKWLTFPECRDIGIYWNVEVYKTKTWFPIRDDISVGISVPPDGMSGTGKEDPVRTGWTRPASPVRTGWRRIPGMVRMKSTRLRNRMKETPATEPDEEYPERSGWRRPGESTHRMRGHICKYVFQEPVRLHL